MDFAVFTPGNHFSISFSSSVLIKQTTVMNKGCPGPAFLPTSAFLLSFFFVTRDLFSGSSDYQLILEISSDTHCASMVMTAFYDRGIVTLYNFRSGFTRGAIISLINSCWKQINEAAEGKTVYSCYDVIKNHHVPKKKAA